jgi:ABC-type amino acid transport substrate-binding protein
MWGAQRRVLISNNQSHPNPNPIRSLDEARALSSIGVVRGDIREEWLLAQGFTNLQASASHAQNLAQLHSGRLDAIAFEPQGLQYLTRERGQSLSAYRPSLQLHSSEIWLLMSRQTPAAEVARWQQAAEQLQQNGTLAAIASQ